jgi:hypothetical protein
MKLLLTFCILTLLLNQHLCEGSAYLEEVSETDDSYYQKNCDNLTGSEDIQRVQGKEFVKCVGTIKQNLCK